MKKLLVDAVKFLAVAATLFTLLFVGWIGRTSFGFIGSCVREITSIIHERIIQCILISCFQIYFLIFFTMRHRLDGPVWRTHNPNPWLSACLLISALDYFLHYSQSSSALTFLVGAVIGQAFAVIRLVHFSRRDDSGSLIRSSPDCSCSYIAESSCAKERLVFLVIAAFLVLLVLASIWSPDGCRIFEYHGHFRWIGPWDNPNIFGLLMGTGIVLAFGVLMKSVKVRNDYSILVLRSAVMKYRAWAFILFLNFAIILMGNGLVHSYCRGAWFGTAIAVIYLILKLQCRKKKCKFIDFPKLWSSSYTMCLAKIQVLKPVILITILVLLFGCFQKIEWAPMQRVFSVANHNDFSWRNRTVAWVGAVQILAKYSWLGAGWGQPEALYVHYYLPPKLDDGGAIETNDYLLLGATLGAPALICFAMYIWLCLVDRERELKMEGAMLGVEERNTEIRRSGIELDWLHTTCRAGAIVLVVGFWFDGGLFYLATTSVFWILLELGRQDLCQAA